MKRNLYKLAMASVGALALGIQSPAFASSDGTLFGGTVGEYSSVLTSADTATLSPSYGHLNNKLVNSAVLIDYETNYDTTLKFAVGAPTLPTSSVEGTGTYTLRLDLGAGQAAGSGGVTIEGAEIELISGQGGGEIASTDITAGTDVHHAPLTITLARSDGYVMKASSSYSLPITITVSAL